MLHLHVLVLLTLLIVDLSEMLEKLIGQGSVLWSISLFIGDIIMIVLAITILYHKKNQLQDHSKQFPAYQAVKVTLEDGVENKFDKKAHVGTSVVLQCGYSASSPNAGNPEIDWSFYPTQKLLNEDQIMSSGVIAARWENKVASDPPASLLLKKTTVEDAGFYKCKITILNDNPNTGRGVYNLTILVPPSKPVCRFPSDHKLTLGGREEFLCSSNQGIPRPTYTWFKDGQPLPTNGQADTRYQNTSYSYNSDTGVMLFSKVNQFDEGTYYCQATNEVTTEECEPVEIGTKQQDYLLLIGIAVAGLCVVIIIIVVSCVLYRQGKCTACCGAPPGKRANQTELDDLDMESRYSGKARSEYSGKARSEFSGYSLGKRSDHPLVETDGYEKGRDLHDQREYSRYSRERLDDNRSDYRERRLDDQKEYSRYSRERLDDDASDYHRNRRLDEQAEYSRYSRERLADTGSEYSGRHRDRDDGRYQERRLYDQREYSRYSRERLDDNRSDYRERRLEDQAEYSRYSRDRLDDRSDYRDRRLDEQREYSRYSRERLDDHRDSRNDYRRYSQDRLDDYNNDRYNQSTDQRKYAPDGGVRVMP